MLRYPLGILIALLFLMPVLQARALAPRQPHLARESTATPWPDDSLSSVKSGGKRELIVLSYRLSHRRDRSPSSSGAPSRYERSARALAKRRANGTAPHVVFVQEAFHPEARRFIGQSGYPYVAEGPRADKNRFGGGLYILSEYPILASSHRAYSQCRGWDCKIRKGVVHARIELPGAPQPVELYNTQTNSGPPRAPWLEPEGSDDVSLLQMQEVREFLWETQAPHLPTIFGGDFNFRAGEDAYLFFNAFALMTDASHSCAITRRCGDLDTIDRAHARGTDRIYSRDGTSPRVSIRPVSLELRRMEPGAAKNLPDHDGIEVRYEVTW